MTAGDYANFIAAFSGSAAAVAAFVTIRTSALERSDERMAAYAVRTLERAYQALVGPEGTANKAPVADRLAWLTSARLIEQYKDAKQKIKNPVVLHECEGHEEHWRHQFYLALSPLENVSPGYYSDRKGNGPIHDVSAVIIHAFASWPDDKEDPVDKYKTSDAAISKLGVSNFWITLRRHLNIL
ncbi:hypothetical protein [Pseudomonas sp. B21-035]|uniref:hypothetical protein n=1 Tax=Pseudomonas sp. B21-035 TaxID=2895484 RepID=UPI00215FF9B5|nr:hypothetical protein [Pseudomonas sp. B21-035]UVL53957.1 hypothetical protein LOY22_13775 [Pseudomonas sp. B21-035]